MKQVLKYSSQHEQAVRAIDALEKVSDEVRVSSTMIDYEAKVQAILNKPAPVIKFHGDKSRILAAAKVRYKKAMGINRKSPCAA